MLTRMGLVRVEPNAWCIHVVEKALQDDKNSIRVVTSLHSSRQLPSLKAVKNEIVTNATESKFNKRAMTINDILEYDVSFSSMVIGYKV